MTDFSSSAKQMRSSEIRRLMKLAADPSIISFAGGMPANTLFPTDVVDELFNGLSLSLKQAALQYGPTPGYSPLLESLKKYLESRGIATENQDLIITTGAQQALNLVAKVFINPGDYVVTEYPSFIGGIAAFKSYEANLVGIPLDNDGIDIKKLRQTLDTLGDKVKLLYISPYFHNPAGIIYSKKRKEELLKLLTGRNICMIEDDPYSELYFRPEDKELTVPMKATGKEPVPICYIGTFAKILGPGLRLGYVLGPKEIVEKCELAKQSMDACTSTMNQVLADQYLRKGKLEPYLNYLRPVYARRAQIMLSALEKYMPAGITWTKPQGGFYVWVTMPETMDASEVFAETIKHGAAFVIGSAFDPEGTRNNSFRLAFSHTPEERIDEGIKIIAEATKKVYFNK